MENSSPEIAASKLRERASGHGQAGESLPAFQQRGNMFQYKCKPFMSPFRKHRDAGSAGTDPGSSRECESVKRQVSGGWVSYTSVTMLSSVQEKRGTPAMG